MKNLIDQIHKTEEMVIGGQLGFSEEASQDSSMVTNFQDQPLPHPYAVES